MHVALSLIRRTDSQAVRGNRQVRERAGLDIAHGLLFGGVAAFENLWMGLRDSLRARRNEYQHSTPLYHQVRRIQRLRRLPKLDVLRIGIGDHDIGLAGHPNPKDFASRLAARKMRFDHVAGHHTYQPARGIADGVDYKRQPRHSGTPVHLFANRVLGKAEHPLAVLEAAYPVGVSGSLGPADTRQDDLCPAREAGDPVRHYLAQADNEVRLGHQFVEQKTRAALGGSHVHKVTGILVVVVDDLEPPTHIAARTLLTSRHRSLVR